MKKYNTTDHVLLLANNILGYSVGCDEYMTIAELHTGYNRMYQLMDRQGTRALSIPLAINQIADVVDEVITRAWSNTR